jgi:hypothetical protein
MSRYLPPIAAIRLDQDSEMLGNKVRVPNPNPPIRAASRMMGRKPTPGALSGQIESPPQRLAGLGPAIHVKPLVGPRPSPGKTELGYSNLSGFGSRPFPLPGLDIGGQRTNRVHLSEAPASIAGKISLIFRCFAAVFPLLLPLFFIRKMPWLQ